MGAKEIFGVSQIVPGVHGFYRIITILANRGGQPHKTFAVYRETESRAIQLSTKSREMWESDVAERFDCLNATETKRAKKSSFVQNYDKELVPFITTEPRPGQLATTWR